MYYFHVLFSFTQAPGLKAPSTLKTKTGSADHKPAADSAKVIPHRDAIVIINIFVLQKAKSSTSATTTAHETMATGGGGEASATVNAEHPEQGIENGNEIMESQNHQDGDH